MRLRHMRPACARATELPPTHATVRRALRAGTRRVHRPHMQFERLPMAQRFILTRV